MLVAIVEAGGDVPVSARLNHCGRIALSANLGSRAKSDDASVLHRECFDERLHRIHRAKTCAKDGKVGSHGGLLEKDRVKRGFTGCAGVTA